LKVADRFDKRARAQWFLGPTPFGARCFICRVPRPRQGVSLIRRRVQFQNRFSPRERATFR
jgi:hypothetical protein